MLIWIEKFFADLIAQINKNTVDEAEPTTPARDRSCTVSSGGISFTSDGMLGDLQGEGQIYAGFRVIICDYYWEATAFNPPQSQ